MIDDVASGRRYLTSGPYPWEKPMTALAPPTSKPVQRKVAFASAGTYVGSLVLTTLIQALQDGSLLAFLPPTVSAIVAPVIPALITFLVGYMTTNKVNAEDAQELARAVEKRAAELVEAKVVAAIDAALAERGQA